MKQWEMIYHCCVRLVLLWCCGTWELTVADEAWLHGVERWMIRMMCGMRLVDWVSTNVLHDRVSVAVKILQYDMMIQTCLWWCGHVMHGDINSLMCKVLENEITWKRKKGWSRIWLGERGCVQSKAKPGQSNC